MTDLVRGLIEEALTKRESKMAKDIEQLQEGVEESFGYLSNQQKPISMGV
jgi:hypothetical protein